MAASSSLVAGLEYPPQSSLSPSRENRLRKWPSSNIMVRQQYRQDRYDRTLAANDLDGQADLVVGVGGQVQWTTWLTDHGFQDVGRSRSRTKKLEGRRSTPTAR